MGYIDIHSHILPNIDDGSKSMEDTITLLTQEKENGVTSVICTPHFYPEADTMESHLLSSRKAFEELKNAIAYKDLPHIFLGHEVQYFTGISKCQSLDKFCIEGTNILLLELPFLTPLSGYMLKEIVSLDRDLGITVILAHIERYMFDKQFKGILKIIKSGSAFGQINADALLNPNISKQLLKLVKKGYVSYVASDAHSPTERPVYIAKAMKIIKEKYGDKLYQIKKNSNQLENMLTGEYDA